VVYQLLLPCAGRLVPTTRLAVGCLGAVSHYLGILAATLGRWDAAAGHLAEAVATNTRAGAVPFVALSRFEHARALRARGAPGDRELAEEQLAQATATARALGLALPADQEAAPPASVPAAVFRREGEYWTIAYRGEAARLRHTVGLGHLARLLGNPGRELHALDLAAGDATRGSATATPVRSSTTRPRPPTGAASASWPPSWRRPSAGPTRSARRGPGPRPTPSPSSSPAPSGLAGATAACPRPPSGRGSTSPRRSGRRSAASPSTTPPSPST
jgi:hypothetical protein